MGCAQEYTEPYTKRPMFVYVCFIASSTGTKLAQKHPKTKITLYKECRIRGEVLEYLRLYNLLPPDLQPYRLRRENLAPIKS